MRTNKRVSWIMVGAILLVWGAPAAALTDEEKCLTEKLQWTGDYADCRLKAIAKEIKTGNSPDYSKCDQEIVKKFSGTEVKFGEACPTEGDAVDILSRATAATDLLTLKLTSGRYVDNGDGTLTDLQTGLMWEKKDDLGGVHDKDNKYFWSTGSPYGPTGSAFTSFLVEMNGGISADGNTITGCFANHCDWRLPTIEELQTILLKPFPCFIDPCINPVFDPTQGGDDSMYWSDTTYSGFTDGVSAWGVFFGGLRSGDVSFYSKIAYHHVRAVRGGF